MSLLWELLSPPDKSMTTTEERPGDRVLILDGPFAGLTGVFDINKDAGRVALLVDLLGRHNRILIERDAISAAL